MAKKSETCGEKTTRDSRLALILALMIPALSLPQHLLAQEQVAPPLATETASDAESPENIPEERVVDTAADQETVLEDYEASEQISEDLSVSFPVDI